MVEFIQLVPTIGVAGVSILAVVLILVWTAKSRSKEADEHQKRIREQQALLAEQQKANTQVLEHTMSQYKLLAETMRAIHDNTNPIHDPKLEKQTATKNMEVQQRLKRLLKKVGAARVSVYTYHNGGVSVYGVPFQKMSITLQEVALGIDNTAASCQQQPRMMYPDLCAAVEGDEGIFAVDDIAKLAEGASTTYMLYTSRCVRAVVANTLKVITPDGTVLSAGFISAEFSEAIEDPKRFKSIKTAVRDTAVAVGVLYDMNDGKPIEVE